MQSLVARNGTLILENIFFLTLINAHKINVAFSG